MRQWFTPHDRLIEVLLKQAVAQHVHGYLDPCDQGSAYDCTILVPQTVETKYDRKATETGNLYFEIRNTRQDRPSGLTSTTADLWAHYVPAPWGCIVLYPPQPMLTFLKAQLDLKRHGYRLTGSNSGDGNSQGILAPIQDILGQPFVQRIAFRVDLPATLEDLSGVTADCGQCNRRVVIEMLQMGICVRCREKQEDLKVLL